MICNFKPSNKGFLMNFKKNIISTIQTQNYRINTVGSDSQNILSGQTFNWFKTIMQSIKNQKY